MTEASHKTFNEFGLKLLDVQLIHFTCADPATQTLLDKLGMRNKTNRESDSLQIVCLSNLLGVGVRVAYLDQSAAAESSAAASAADSMRTYEFPEGSRARVYLLYRPGHYDVLTELSVAAAAAAESAPAQ